MSATGRLVRSAVSALRRCRLEATPQRVRPAAGRVALVLRRAVARAHRAALRLAADAGPVAHLDAAEEPALLRVVEHRRRVGAARGRAARASSPPSPARPRPCRGSARCAGSKPRFTWRNASYTTGPNIFRFHSLRTSPSPCSPLRLPLNSSTRSVTSSMMRRIVTTSFGSCRFSTGRMCRQPTLGVAVERAVGAVAVEDFAEPGGELRQPFRGDRAVLART